MSVISISLNEKLEARLRKLVEDGEFDSLSEAVRHAAKLLLDQKSEAEWFKARIEEGLVSVEKGDVVPFEPEKIFQEAILEATKIKLGHANKAN